MTSHWDCLLPNLCSYLFNLIGQFIGSHALQDQYWGIISALLRNFKSNPSKDQCAGRTTSGICHLLITKSQVFCPILSQHLLLSSDCVLLQFLVSKLVACCIPSEANGEDSGTRLSQVLSLLLLLTVDSDPAFYDFIRVGFLEANYFICM